VRDKQFQSSAILPNPPDHVVGVTTRDGQTKMFNKGRGVTIKNQTLHATIDRAPVQIPLAEVQRYWIETTHVSVVRTVGLVAGVAGGIAIAAILVDHAVKGAQPGTYTLPPGDCCLFVYSWDGQRYSFDTEAYTAAITRGLERDDYSALPQLRERDGQYRLMISNDQDETQFTNLLELWVVDHAPGVTPRAGADGRLYGISAPQPPLSARDGEGKDLALWLDKRDSLIWEPEPAADRSGSLDREVLVTFPRPPEARQARLIASATYTIWSGDMAGQILGLLGRDLPAWYREIDENPPPATTFWPGWRATGSLPSPSRSKQQSAGSRAPCCPWADLSSPTSAWRRST
jgi:hypothetical protein